MSHMCHGQNLGSSWARAFTGRRFHAILMWWVLCFPDCQLPLVGVIRLCLSVLLGIERLTSSWFLVLTSVCRPSALCPECIVDNTGETCCDCRCLWKTASLLVPTFSAATCDCLPHDGSRLYAELGAVGQWNKRLQCCCQFGMAQKQSD